METYVITREDYPELMLQEIHVSIVRLHASETITWTRYPEWALHYNQEEAQAVVDFITNAVDWELGELLEVRALEEVENDECI